MSDRVRAKADSRRDARGWMVEFELRLTRDAIRFELLMWIFYVEFANSCYPGRFPVAYALDENVIFLQTAQLSSENSTQMMKNDEKEQQTAGD
jgi:hypothetical protein